jgi:tyrosyl-tRNA synthetase
MQGYDAYALDCDVQVGGTDQLFNIVTAARKLMAFMGKKPNVGVILDILPGTDGEIKMSKSLGNHIPLLASPEDMYGKVMSVPDKAMPYYFRLVTRWKPDEIQEMEAGLVSGDLHPRDIKMKLAHEIVSIYHSPEDAGRGQAEFIRVFQKGDVPEEMDSFRLEPGMTVLEVLLASGLVSSNGDGRRMLAQNAVRLDGGTLTDPHSPFPGEGVLQVGKRKFVRIEIR